MISELSEKVVVRLIEENVELNDLHDSYWSGCHSGHSAETVHLKLHSDTAEALDEGSMTALIIFYLSAAFDVIDHPILLNHLELSIRTKEKALTRVKSYLTDITQDVSIRNKT